MEQQLILVDDDPVVNFVHKRMVTKYGLGEPLIFESGRMALDYLVQHCHEDQKIIILLDINMPGMSGWEVLDKISGSDLASSVEVFMLTSSVAEEDMRKSEDYDLVKAYLTKPLTESLCMQLKTAIATGS